MIEREVIEFVAAADWTDDCRIRVELKKRITKLSIAEARAFRRELDAAIDEAARGADALRHEHAPAAFDVQHISPDCRDGNKHAACIGRAWDDGADREVPCECPCHRISTSGQAA